MSFVRSNARQTLWRWREVLIALVALALGGFWVFASIGILHWLGYVVIIIGIALLTSGLQRVRFRGGAGGPGVVHVDEAQVAYFGPLTGGVVALGDMTTLLLDPTGSPAHWVLVQPGQGDLMVPLTAEGADQLFDAFASLPGIQTERMLAQMKRPGGEPVMIWQKSGQHVRKILH